MQEMLVKIGDDCMEVREAYNIMKSEYPNKKLIECLEFDDFFAFCLVDRTVQDGDLIGGAYDTVDRKTGGISSFNPIQNLAAFMEAKIIDISTLD